MTPAPQSGSRTSSYPGGTPQCPTERFDSPSAQLPQDSPRCSPSHQLAARQARCAPRRATHWIPATSSSSPILLYAQDWNGSANGRTTAQWQQVAQTHALLVGGTGAGYGNMIPQLHAWNPSLKVLVYDLGPYTIKGSAEFNTLDRRASELLRSRRVGPSDHDEGREWLAGIPEQLPHGRGQRRVAGVGGIARPRQHRPIRL